MSKWGTSMPQSYMDRIVAFTAEVEDITFEGARGRIVDSMEVLALTAERQGLASWEMWAEYGRMALRARPPRGWDPIPREPKSWKRRAP